MEQLMFSKLIAMLQSASRVIGQELMACFCCWVLFVSVLWICVCSTWPGHCFCHCYCLVWTLTKSIWQYVIASIWRGAFRSIFAFLSHDTAYSEVHLKFLSEEYHSYLCLNLKTHCKFRRRKSLSYLCCLSRKPMPNEAFLLWAQVQEVRPP